MPKISTKPEVFYWDSCVFIDLLQRTSGRIVDIEELVACARSGKLRIITSTITLTEVIKAGHGKKGAAKDQREILTLFEEDWIVLWQVDRETAVLAGSLRMSQTPKLTTADAIHLATALRAKVSVLHTYDHDDLLKRDGKIGSPALKIKEPSYDPNRPLLHKHK